MLGDTQVGPPASPGILVQLMQETPLVSPASGWGGRLAACLLFSLFRVLGAAVLAPPCSPNHFCFPGGAGGAFGMLSLGFQIPQEPPHFCCVMIGRGDWARQERQILLSHELLPQPSAGCLGKEGGFHRRLEEVKLLENGRSFPFNAEIFASCLQSPVPYMSKWICPNELPSISVPHHSKLCFAVNWQFPLPSGLNQSLWLVFAFTASLSHLPFPILLKFWVALPLKSECPGPLLTQPVQATIPSPWIWVART